MTLFAHATVDSQLFEIALRKYFGGEPNPLTLERLYTAPGERRRGLDGVLIRLCGDPRRPAPVHTLCKVPGLGLRYLCVDTWAVNAPRYYQLE